MATKNVNVVVTHDKTLNIYQRMLNIVRHVPYVQKEQKKVNGQYTFASHDAVTDSVRIPFCDYGVLPICTTISHKCEPHIIKQDKKTDLHTFKTTIMMRVKFVNVDKPEEFITVKMPGEGIDNQDKGIGKAESYAFKYACLKAFMMRTGDDPDNTNNVGADLPQQPAADFPSTYQMDMIRGLFHDIAPSEEELKNPSLLWVSNALKDNDIFSQLNIETAGKLINQLQKYKTAKKKAIKEKDEAAGMRDDNDNITDYGDKNG